MKKRERILVVMNHKEIDRIPIMYRGLKGTNKKLLRYFRIIGPVERKVLKLNEKLKADNLLEEGKVGNNKYANLKPKYIGPISTNIVEIRDADLCVLSASVHGLNPKVC